MKAHKSVDDALDKGDVMRSYDAIAELINDELSEKQVTRKLCFGAGFAAYSGDAYSFDADPQNTDYSRAPKTCDLRRGHGGWSACVRGSYRDA